jgi:superfamily I DNA and/or RNA helicase
VKSCSAIRRQLNQPQRGVHPPGVDLSSLAHLLNGRATIEPTKGLFLDGVRVGTVDKFQGQEAPVVFYSMATSTPEDAPRGMEFLYSLNRLNVATSRAQCVAVIVASPALFQPQCKTPRQMKLVNALCRYSEMATAI